MKDVQSERDYRNIPLKHVGINNLKWPVVVKDKKNGTQNTIATVSLSVDLPHFQRGTHMSRFVEVIKELKSVSPKDIEGMLNDLKEKLDAQVAHCRMEFDYFIYKPSPVTKIESPYDVQCAFEATKNHEFDFILEVKVPVTTLCPCSKEISEFGAHNQRATVDIKIKSDKMIWIEDIVKVAEESASTPVFSLLKRKDEKWVTEMAYLNPRFVEDVAREVAVRLEANKDIKWYSVCVESIESIHNHNAFAYTEKGMME
ncbi:GTP cyclohydrolase FolE2 [Thermobrachium celere]|uniref:GTP cyclohydrolase FolE2 n=1 Tax=Thermobrachium celere TaxID=53422 RepID=UPI0019450F06|nr:GTP cyclohydrolase FolE2 [Thermobrachium celere]GFR34814.1 GTP cyclohydrolase FolE2 [Thermobrachium celere]